MTTKQQQLKKLFEKRKIAYTKVSNTILEELRDEVLTGIFAYFAAHDEVGEGRRLVWEEVGYIEQHEMLIVMGVLQYDVGSTVVDEHGETVTITEELAPYFQRVVKVGLPFEIVEASKEDVMMFLLERDKQSEEEQKEAIQFLRDVIGETSDELEDREFNFDDLTEDQQARLVVPNTKKVIN
jgi:hypothetical protein